MTDQRSTILACACELYIEDGLEGFSMRKLARQVGVTAPALYRHYESKEHLLADVVREAYRTLTHRLYRALEGRSAEERFRRAGEAYLDFALEHPRFYRMIFVSSELMGMEAWPEDLQAQGCAVHQFWTDRLRECMEAGLLREGDPEEVGMTLWAHSHGLVSLYHLGHLQMDEETFREAYGASARRLLCGIATETYAEELGRRMSAPVPQTA